MPLSVPGTSGIADAPSNGNDYVRINGVWSKRYISGAPISGNWYPADIVQTSQAGGDIGAGTIRYAIAVFRRDVTITDLLVRVSTGVVANIQLALYAASPTTGGPTGTPVVQTGSISVTTTATTYGSAVTPTLIQEGVYWFGVNADTAGVVCQTSPVGRAAAAYYFGSPTIGDVTGSVTLSTYIYTQSQAFGTWPDASAATRVATTAGVQASALCYYRVQ